MRTNRSRKVVFGVVLGAGLLVTACRATYVVVPRPSGGYTRVDTLRGRTNGRDVLVRFHHDTTWRVDTVVRYDTLWRGGTRIITRVDTVVRRDTIRIGQPPIRQDSVATIRPRQITDRDPVRPRVDTIHIVRVDTIRVPVGSGRIDTIRVTRVDTLRVTRVDTVRVARVDTVRLSRVDTVRVAGPRAIFIPPGQMPREGLCRIWYPDRPPGQQPDPQQCAGVASLPAGTFILHDGRAWDSDYDWVAESRRSQVPAVIVALSRRHRP